MDFIGTRGDEKRTPSRALINGIGDLGGLYAPTVFPDLSPLVDSMYNLDYKALAYAILKPYLSDFTEDELKGCIEKAYDAKFTSRDITPLAVAGDYYFLELFKGRTFAFKDIALSILPHFLTLAAKKTAIDKKLLILTATSGDTGKAALEGFANVPGVKIAVFYPIDGVSDIQKLQMITGDGDNTAAIGIRGNFDDAQKGVKHLFADIAFKSKINDIGFIATSANSINIGRLLPQIVYYFSSYAQMVNKGIIKPGERINFTVPTGNFGNILAGYYAYKSGLPVNKLICASNENKVLTDFFTTGEYNANRKFYCTISPSMDILISSNLERLLFDLSGADSVKAAMVSLAESKRYVFTHKTDIINGVYASSGEALAAIGEMFRKGYLIDTHTAIGFAAYNKYLSATGDKTKNIILATASPYKFPKDVLRGIGEDACGLNEFEAIRRLAEHTNTNPPEAIVNLEHKTIRHDIICDTSDMQDVIINFLRK